MAQPTQHTAHARVSTSLTHAPLCAVPALLLALTFGTATMAGAVCPSGVTYIDLKTGFSSFGNSQVTLQSPIVASSLAGCRGWKEAVLKIDLAGCTKATLVAAWDGLPKNWTFNLGDSPTNDGYAGDAGTTIHDAELWVLGERMSIANSGAIPDNPTLGQDLSLTDSAMEFVVKNQYVSWGQPYGFLQTPASQALFALPDNDPATPAAEQGSKIYAGLNRVIGSNFRQGCGLRRVLVVLE